LSAPRPGDLGEQLLETTAGDGIVEREIRPAEKGRSVGRQENREGVAAQPGEELHGLGVALGHIGPLVAIDAHRDDQRIDHRTQYRVAIHLEVHHAAPATVIGADVQEDRPVEPRGERERIAPPLLPAHRLVRRAGEVRRRRLGHAVRERSVLRDAASREQRHDGVFQGSHEERLEDTLRRATPFRHKKSGLGAPPAEFGRAVPPSNATVLTRPQVVQFAQLLCRHE